MSAVNTVRQPFQLFALTIVEQFFKVLQEEFATHQFGKLFLLLNDATVLFFNATQSVEVLRMDNFSKNADIKQATAINSCDFLGEALDKTEQFLQPIIGEHVHDPQCFKAGPNAVNASGTLDHARGIPMEIIVNQYATIL